jgi:hypothetical protein
MCVSAFSSSASSMTEVSSRPSANDGLTNGQADRVAGDLPPLEKPLAMLRIYKDFAVCDLTIQTEDGRYMARAAVVARSGGRTLFQRFLDFETYESEAEATARAQAGARAWIDEETSYVPLALPTSYAGRFIPEEIESVGRDVRI